MALPFKTPPETIVFFGSGVGLGAGGGGGSSPPVTAGPAEPLPSRAVPAAKPVLTGGALVETPESVAPLLMKLLMSRATSLVVSFATSCDFTTGAMTEISVLVTTAVCVLSVAGFGSSF